MLRTISVLSLLVMVLVASAAEEPIDRLAAEMHEAGVVRADDGTVTGFQVSSHNGAIKRNPDGRRFVDADVEVLLQYPELRVLEIEKSELTQTGAELIGRMSQLEELEFWASIPRADHGEDPTIHQHFANLRSLRKLDFKHNHGDVATLLGLGTFPQLETLVLDGHHSEPGAIPFLEANPTITELHLHRTGMSNDEFGQVVDALPLLERLQLKPANQDEGTVGGPGFAHLARAEHLRGLDLAHQWDQVQWEGELEHLVDAPALTVVRASSVPEELLKQLSEADPELYVFGRGFGFHAGKRYDDENDKEARELRNQVSGDWQAH